MAGPSGSNAPMIGLQFNTIVSTVVDSLNIITPLTGFDDDFFQNWYISVVRKYDGTGAAPQGDYILCTSYVSQNGQLTLERGPNGLPFNVGDQIYLLHPVLLGSLNVVVQPSDNVKQSSDGEISTASLAYVKVKELAFTGAIGGARIFFDLKVNAFGGTAYAVVYKNGVPVVTNPLSTPPYTEWSDATGVYQSFEQDINGLVTGDLIQIYARVTVGNTAFVKNFEIGYNIVALPAAQADIDKVYYDSINGVSGTAWPVGTPGNPVNNIADMVTIAIERGLRAFQIRGTITIDRDMAGYIFYGGSPNQDIINLAGFNISNSVFNNLWVLGIGIGGATPTYIDHCILGNTVSPCTLTGLILCYVCGVDALNIVAGGVVSFYDSYLVNGAVAPPTWVTTITGGGILYLINCTGELILATMTDPASSIIVDGGCPLVQLAAGVIEGIAYIVGVGVILDDRSAGATVLDFTNYPKPEAPININAIVGAEIPVIAFNGVATDNRFTLNQLYLKSENPVADTILIRLYQLINNIPTIVRQFVITGGGGGNWVNYLSLVDMFNLGALFGRYIIITAEVIGVGGPYNILGQYQYQSA